MLPLNTQYLIMCLCYIITYCYSLIFAVYASKKPELNYINDIHKTCVIGCNEQTKILTSMRGNNYYIAELSANENVSSCLITAWTIFHYLLYTVLGFACPSLFWPTFSIGVLFELYEREYYQCEDALDIIANTAGFATGYMIQKYVS